MGRQEWLEEDEIPFKEHIIEEYVDELKRLRSLIAKCEKTLEDLNGEKGELCIYCDANTYNGKEGIEHYPDCIILKLRKEINETN